MDTKTTAFAEPLSLSLRALPRDDSDTKSLPSLIARINRQRGAFRNVTESGLEGEIDSSASVVDADPEDVTDIDGTETSVEGDRPKEDLLTVKEEILKQIGQAHNEAYAALDFISLLLSKHTPRQAEISMSSFIKQQVPLGTLGAEKVLAPKLSDSEREDDKAVSRGWKLGAFHSAADLILSSAIRLEKEVERETKYWEQVLAVSRRGWSLCRQPREKHTLGVRYGFREAANEFRDRGLASLRRGEDGNIIFDQGYSNSIPKTIRVRIENGDKNLTGSSRVTSAFTADASVEDHILQARNTIYDEELLHEISREARLLGNQSVRNIGSALAFNDSGRRFLIDLIPLEDQEGVSTQSMLSEDDSLANATALALRVLLSHAHRQNLRRRSQIPPPVTERKRTTPAYFLLRPILSHLSHQSAIRSVVRYLDSLTASLGSAGLGAKYNIRIATHSALAADGTYSKSRSMVEDVIQAVIDRLDSSVDITVGGSAGINVKMRTQMRPPNLGTEYLISVSKVAGAPESMRIDSEEETERYIDHLITMSITEEVASYSRAPDTSAFPRSADADINVDGETGWVRSAQMNELQKTFKNTGKSKLMVFQVSSGTIRLRCGWMGGKSGQVDEAYLWDGKANGETRKPLREVVKLAGTHETARSQEPRPIETERENEDDRCDPGLKHASPFMHAETANRLTCSSMANGRNLSSQPLILVATPGSPLFEEEPQEGFAPTDFDRGLDGA
ncbi:MAG: RNA polymerase II mediator complex subunit [Sclerophora amabilis]|nr:MAG: RNA polymerase II mediator complex subunit [Sclerophora amabilis]